jgi:hypothetical protein
MKQTANDVKWFKAHGFVPDDELNDEEPFWKLQLSEHWRIMVSLEPEWDFGLWKDGNWDEPIVEARSENLEQAFTELRVKFGEYIAHQVSLLAKL